MSDTPAAVRYALKISIVEIVDCDGTGGRGWQLNLKQLHMMTMTTS